MLQEPGEEGVHGGVGGHHVLQDCPRDGSVGLAGLAGWEDDLVVVSPQLVRESDGEGLVVTPRLEPPVAAQVGRLPVQLGQQAGHVRVRSAVRRLAVYVVAVVGVRHQEQAGVI